MKIYWTGTIGRTVGEDFFSKNKKVGELFPNKLEGRRDFFKKKGRILFLLGGGRRLEHFKNIYVINISAYYNSDENS